MSLPKPGKYIFLIQYSYKDYEGDDRDKSDFIYADTFEEAKSALFSDLEYDGVDTETVFIETVYKVEVKSVEEIKED